jgi:hypothetical protein
VYISPLHASNTKCAVKVNGVTLEHLRKSLKTNHPEFLKQYDIEQFRFVRGGNVDFVPIEKESKIKFMSLFTKKRDALLTPSIRDSKIDTVFIESTSPSFINLYKFNQCLDLIIIKDHQELAKEFLDALGTSPNLFSQQDDVLGFTLLHYACVYGNLFAADALLKLGSDPQASDARRWSPLHYAAYKGHLEIALLFPADYNYLHPTRN